MLTDVTVPELSTWLQDRQVIQELIHQHLARAKERMQKQVDKNRSERQFKVGDLVFVKIQPYIKSTLASRANQKLSFKYYGPFKILSRVGTVAYKLKLPPSTAVHPVFHISQLKAAVLPGTKVSPSLPSDTDMPCIPVEILQTRMAPKANGIAEEGLVRWSDWSSDMATWENLAHLRQAFPHAPAWGQPGSQGPGNVISTPSEEGPGEEAIRPRAGTRLRKPNIRLAGREWA